MGSEDSQADASCILVIFWGRQPGVGEMLGKPIPTQIPNCGYLVHVKDHDNPYTASLALFEVVHTLCIFLLGPACGHFLLAREELLKSFDNVGLANRSYIVFQWVWVRI